MYKSLQIFLACFVYIHSPLRKLLYSTYLLSVQTKGIYNYGVWSKFLEKETNRWEHISHMVFFLTFGYQISECTLTHRGLTKHEDLVPPQKNKNKNCPCQ